MSDVVNAGIGVTFFRDAEHTLVWDWITDHWQRYAKSPGERALKAKFPTYKVVDAPEPSAYYIKQIRSARRYDLLATAVTDAADFLQDDDPDEAERQLRLGMTALDLAVSVLSDYDFTDPDAFDKQFTLYDELRRDPGLLRGIPTGYDTIDIATMGLQDGQLVTLVGPPKAGKSTIALHVAKNMSDAGYNVLLISFEMGYHEQVARYFGMAGKLNWRRLVKGKMSERDEIRLEGWLRKLEKREHGKLILSEDITSTTTVSAIGAKIQQHRPDVVIVDGVYMMEDENGERPGTSQAITNITRGLKRLTQAYKIPALVTTQVLLSKMRGQRIETNSIGYSSSFGQDSDVVIATEPRDNDADPLQKDIFLKTLLSRHGPLVEVQIDFDWHTSTFTEFLLTDGKAPDPDDYDPPPRKGRL